MSEVVFNKALDGYEDDFEKDLDWLISEESRSEDQGPDYDDIEAEIDKELEESEKEGSTKEERANQKAKEKRRRAAARGAGDDKEEEEEEDDDDDEERWPSPMEPLEYDSDRNDSPARGSPTRVSPALAPPPAVAADEQTDEEKKYILDRIQQANRELRDQEAPDATRRRRLHFKEKLVDLVVPPLEYPHNRDDSSGAPAAGAAGAAGTDAETEGEVSGRLSELNISPRKDSAAAEGPVGDPGGEKTGVDHGGEGGKEGRVLVEKDGKFDLVSLKEVESHGLLPPLAKHSRDNAHSPRPKEASPGPNKTRPPASSSAAPAARPLSHQSVERLRAPRPPSQPRSRPSSASHSLRGSQKEGAKRRVQSATGSPSQAMSTVSPQQKETLQRIQQRRDRLAREEEQRKQEEEEQKRQDNELAFRAWLKRKREQLREERRVHRAQEMERQNSRRDTGDGEQAFRFWLRRKQEQQHRERELEELKKLEEESGYVLHNREECERAFKEWLKLKRAEKRAEQQAARQLSRRLVVEERRARRMQDLQCSVNEAKPFRFTESLSYRF